MVDVAFPQTAEENLRKLTQFRQFYIIVVSYIYFTRIAVFLLGATLPFQLVRAPALFSLVPSLSCASHPPVHTHPSPAYTSAICVQAWLRDFFSEGATVLFYCITGFKFAAAETRGDRMVACRIRNRRR